MKTLEYNQRAMAGFSASDGSVCCFTCKHWIGKRRKETAYCMRLHIGGKDAPSGDSKCVLWEKRPNARSTPNAGAMARGLAAPGSDNTTEIDG